MKKKKKGSRKNSEKDLKIFESNMKFEVEIQGYKGIYALDPKSMSNKYGKFDIRDKLGIKKVMGQGICDYFCNDKPKNTITLVEFTNLTLRFSEGYSKDEELLNEILDKVIGTYGLIIELINRGNLKPRPNFEVKFLLVVEGLKNSGIDLKVFNADIQEVVAKRFNFPTKVETAEKFWRKHRKILKLSNFYAE